MNTVEDLYPSRNGSEAGLIARVDPVVYTDPASVPTAGANGAPAAPIDPDVLKSYEDNGFMLLEGVFSEAEVEEIRAELDRLRFDPVLKTSEQVITEPGSGDIRSIFKVHDCSALFARLVSDARLVNLARYILGDEVYIHQSRLNYKPGFRGRGFYWHSDFETWHVEDGMPRMRALSMSILLTENTHCNGPLMLVPGSHREFAICGGETPANHYRRSLKKQEIGVPSDAIISHFIERGGIYTATASAGSVLVFDCNTLHGSGSNITPQPRSNAFFVYNAISNRVGPPYCSHPPRPDFIATRERVEPVAGGQAYSGVIAAGTPIALESPRP